MQHTKKSSSAVSSPKINNLAIAGFVLAFFLPPIGFILAAVSLWQVTSRRQKGTGLAIAALIISSLLTLFLSTKITLFTQNVVPNSVMTNVQIGKYNSERKTDINSMRYALDNYYEKAGSYPSLKDLNSEAWRKSAGIQLMNRALCDPIEDSSTKKCELVSTPKSGKYSYQTWNADGVTPCTAKAGEFCAKFTLVAVLQKQTAKSPDTYVKHGEH